jgi:hypothetical protein
LSPTPQASVRAKKPDAVDTAIRQLYEEAAAADEAQAAAAARQETLEFGAVGTVTPVGPETDNPPFLIPDVRPVDDAGGVHLETVLTAEYLMAMVARKQLRLQNNIRPDHDPNYPTSKRTWRKITSWEDDLLNNDAVLGNLSICLDPTSTISSLVSGSNGRTDLEVTKGYTTTRVDSESRIRSIVLAMHSQVGTMNPGMRIAVRVWRLNAADANRVAVAFNTQGEHVVASASLPVYQKTPPEKQTARLVMHSPHLTLANVENHSNSVSASSPKLAAYNTFVQAMNEGWRETATTEAKAEEYGDYLIQFWNALVAVRAEYGRLPLSQRKQQRATSLSGSAISLYGVIGLASTCFAQNLDPATVLEGLRESNQTVEVPVLDAFGKPVLDANNNAKTQLVDVFSNRNPRWADLNIIRMVPNKDGELRPQFSTTFQTRREMIDEFHRLLGLPLP